MPRCFGASVKTRCVQPLAAASRPMCFVWEEGEADDAEGGRGLEFEAEYDGRRRVRDEGDTRGAAANIQCYDVQASLVRPPGGVGRSSGSPLTSL
jgi:hypothetical protein